MVAGCKCPGSCACKIKKPRKPKALKKAVVGGRVRQPQVIIQGMPAVSTTAIPQGYPYLTVTSDAAAKRSMTTQTETQAQPEIKKEVKEEPLRELKGESLSLFLPTQTPSQQLSLLKSKITAGTTKKFPVLRATTGTQAGPSLTTTGTQAGPSLTTTEVQTEAPTRMTTEAQTNLIEHVGVGTQATKETREMATETEPLLVNVAKGAKQDIFNIMKQQEATGKIISLTGAGRPARPFNESLGLAYSSPSPVAPVSYDVPGYPKTIPGRIGSVIYKGKELTIQYPDRIQYAV